MESKSLEKCKVSNDDGENLDNDVSRNHLPLSNKASNSFDQQKNDANATNNMVIKIDQQSPSKSSKAQSKRKSQLPRVLSSVSDGVRKTAKFLGKNNRINNKRPKNTYQVDSNFLLHRSGDEENMSLKLSNQQNDSISQAIRSRTQSFGSLQSFVRSYTNISSSSRNEMQKNEIGNKHLICEETVVHMLESFLRRFLYFGGTYILGVYTASNDRITSMAYCVVELGAVAWATCLLIICLTFYQNIIGSYNKSELQKENADLFVKENEQNKALEERIQLIQNDNIYDYNYQSISDADEKLYPDELLHLPSTKKQDNLHSVFKPNQSSNSIEPEKTIESKALASSQQKGALGDCSIEKNDTKERKPIAELDVNYQKELNDLYVINSTLKERLIPNSTAHIMDIDHELYSGKVLLLIKTKNNLDDPFGDYFDTKQRRFEMRLQLKFKKVPEHPIYLACELDKAMKLGVVQRAFLRATLNFIKKMNSGLHYNLNGTDGVSETDLRDGNCESATIAFTLNSMDRIVETKPGEIVPNITSELYESPETIKQRRKKIHFDFNAESTYTMAFWSAYTDLLQWKTMNLPAIKPFSLSSVFGKQAFRVVIYSLKPSEKGLHLRNCKNILEEYEFSHVRLSGLGKLALEWEKENKTKKNDTPSIAKNNDNSNLTIHASYELNNSIHTFIKPELDTEDNIGQTNDIDDDNDMEEVEDLSEGIYLKSGDPIFLRDADSRDDSSFLTIGRGFAILQSHTSTIIQIEKGNVSQSKHAFKLKRKLSRRDKSKLIHSGDIVSVKLILNGNGEESRNIRYLTTHKRKWLKWVSTIPRYNCYFQIINAETEGLQQTDLIPNDISTESQNSYVRLGGSFLLKHCRWPSFVVGVNIKTSARLGGQVLALTRNQTVPALECSDEDDDDTSQDSQQIKDKKQWTSPLHLRAELPTTRLTLSSLSSNYCSPINHQPSSPFFDEDKTKILNCQEWFKDFLLDVPAWIEMTHRTNRTIQRVYVLRIIFNRKLGASNSFVEEKELEESLGLKNSSLHSHSESFEKENVTKEELNLSEATLLSNSKSFVRLRTGKDLSIILQMGMSKSVTSNCGRKENDSVEKREPNQILVQSRDGHDDFSTELSICHDQTSCLSDDSDDSSKETDAYSYSRDENDEQNDINQRLLNGYQSDKSRESSFFNANSSMPAIPRTKLPLYQLERAKSAGNFSLYKPIDPLGRSISQLEETQNLGVDNSNDKDDYDFNGGIDEHDNLGGREDVLVGTKRKKWISKPAGGIVKVAKNVKTGTVITRKQVVKQGKKVGKGTVNAGRAITKRIQTSTITPSEPRLSKTKDKTTMKRPGRDHHVAVNKTLKNMEKTFLPSCSSRILAGELSAPDQSCRTVSKVLTEISANKTVSSPKLDGKVLLESELAVESDLDTWFLRGGPAELGITPNEPEQTIGQAIVAHCLWESHWREEWFGLYRNYLCLYAPLTKKPSLTISYMDIQDIRRLGFQGTDSPLPVFPILAIDTAWRCYYFAFFNEEKRETCIQTLFSAIFNDESQGRKENNDAWKAHLLQGFQTSVDTYRFNCGGKWARISSQSKSNQRTLLNIRKMAFDLEPFPSENLYKDERAIGVYVEKLLAKALSFSIESFEKSAVEFVEFLDDTSRLKSLPLQKLDYSGKEAFCIFVNLYHCLLQHSLLLSIDGPLTKRSFGQFMKTSCYEIGGDVFSLAEIECCVIRGALSSPINPKPPFVEISKKRNGYRAYELLNVDPRVNFILHSGDISKGSRVPILSPNTLEETMVKYTASFFRRNFSIDSLKKSLTLPKVFEVYRNDFENGDPKFIVPYCLQYVDEETKCMVLKYINDESMSYSIKYQSYCDQFCSNLKIGD